MFIHYISKYGLTKLTKEIYSKLESKNKKDLPYNDRFVTHYYFKYLAKSLCSHWEFGSKCAITYKECLSYKKGVFFFIYVCYFFISFFQIHILNIDIYFFSCN